VLTKRRNINKIISKVSQLISDAVYFSMG